MLQLPQHIFALPLIVGPVNILIPFPVPPQVNHALPLASIVSTTIADALRASYTKAVGPTQIVFPACVPTQK